MFNFKENMKAILYKRDDNFYSLKVDGIVMATSNGMLVDYNLSKQNCDDIFGVVDLMKLAYDWVFETNEHKWSNNDDAVGDNYGSYKEGFNKAMELNKDKVFTLGDLMNCWNKALKFQEHKETLGEFIQSLQQPTEIDVVIEMECPQCQEWGYVECRKDCNKKFLQPKLDSEGCLILKNK
jgi:hypothetical protein